MMCFGTSLAVKWMNCAPSAAGGLCSIWHKKLNPMPHGAILKEKKKKNYLSFKRVLKVSELKFKDIKTNIR